MLYRNECQFNQHKNGAPSNGFQLEHGCCMISFGSVVPCGVEEVDGLVEPYGIFARTEMIPNDACMMLGADDDAQEADMDAGLNAGR